MKKISTYVAFSILVFGCTKNTGTTNANTATNSPQITATAFITSMQPNTITEGYVLDSNVVAIPQNGINILYNYANVSDIKKWKDSIKSPINLTDYPVANYMVGLNQDILNQNIEYNQYFQINNNSWNNLGSYYGVPINFTYSGYGVDIPKQASKNTSSQSLVNFPITYNDSLTQNVTSKFNTTVTGTISGITINGPLTTTTTTKINSKNIAYGILKIKGYNDSLEVVIQKYTTTIKTNFSSSNILINGVLKSVLSQFNLVNDKEITATIYRYWAKNKGLIMTIEIDGKTYVRTGL
jgi:hypothetical protein